MGKYNIERISQQIRIGWDGENNWRPQTFDCSSLLATRPNGTVTLWILPNGESEAFPVALTADGNLRTWTPLDSELTGGGGKLQFHCQDGEDVGKSPVYRYVVEGSILTGAEHPAGTPSWAVQVVADVTEAADRAEAAAESIDPESIEQTVADAVEDYIEQHPVTVEETDPTVPAWAKNPQKPSYTAAEVGALPDSYTPPVTSVNGQTGDVVIQAGGGAVDSVNGKTGAVTITATELGALTEHQSLAAYRTASAQDAIDAAQDTAIAGKYTKPSGGIPASDLAAGVIPSLSGYATEQWVQNQGYLTQHQSLTAYQTKAITDTGGYYTTDTVEGALQEIGAELAGVNTLIGSGVIS